MKSYIKFYNYLRAFDFLGPLTLRLILGPVMIMAGVSKVYNIESTAAWFEGALHFPMPVLMAWLAGLTELIGGWCLILGFAVRWVSIPLAFVMFVAATTVHWDNGWQAISDSNALFATERVEQASIRLSKAKEILKRHGNYQWLTEKGRLVVLNNGIEFAAIYFAMLLTLIGIGGGRFVSIDYYIGLIFKNKSEI